MESKSQASAKGNAWDASPSSASSSSSQSVQSFPSHAPVDMAKLPEHLRKVCFRVVENRGKCDRPNCPFNHESKRVKEARGFYEARGKRDVVAAAVARLTQNRVRRSPESRRKTWFAKPFSAERARKVHSSVRILTRRRSLVRYEAPWRFRRPFMKRSRRGRKVRRFSSSKSSSSHSHSSSRSSHSHSNSNSHCSIKPMGRL